MAGRPRLYKSHGNYYSKPYCDTASKGSGLRKPTLVNDLTAVTCRACLVIMMRDLTAAVYAEEGKSGAIPLETPDRRRKLVLVEQVTT